MTPILRQSITCGLFWIPFLLLISCISLADSAAERDWRPDDQPEQCSGSYVEPLVESGPAMHASANTALHVEGHSTTLNGNITVTQDNQQLSADFLTIDAATEIYTAEGNIALRQPGLLMTGERISGSLFNNTAALDSASFLLHMHRVRGKAARISKNRDNDLTIEDGNFTTCEPDSNAWQVAGKEIILKNSEGYGVAKNVTLKIKDVPVAYFPWFRFPIDDSRHSGLLTPSVGQDSDSGTDIAIPYYFNLKENLDATYTLRNMHKRGLMHEGEARFLSQNTNNLIAVTYLPNDKIYDNREIITPGRRFPEQDRWLAHITHSGSAGNWSSRINFTSVSDIDYFHDLGTFTSTTTRFDQALGESDRPAILRTGRLSYDREHWGSALDLRSFQELNQVQTKQYAVLPRLSLYGQQRLASLELNGLAQLTEFDKSDASPDGARLVIDGKASWPLRQPWGYIKPAVRTIYRDYDLNNTDPTNRDSISLTTMLGSVDMGLTFVRDTKFRGQAFRQTLEPRMFYLYAEEDFQDDLPSFDSTPMTPSYDSLFRDTRYTGYDRIGDANQIALGLTTRYFSLSGTPTFSASVGQIFHLEDREVIFGSTPGIDPAADTSPIFASLQTTYRNFDVNAQYEYDSDSDRSNRGYISLRYRSANSSLFNFTYAMTNSSVQRNRLIRPEEETDLSFLWPFNNQLNLVGRWNYAWDSQQTIESLLGVEYNACCWKARVLFRRNLEEPRRIGITSPNGTIEYVTDRRADSGIYFEFQLRGLASLGGRLDSLIQDSVPGFTGDR